EVCSKEIQPGMATLVPSATDLLTTANRASRVAPTETWLAPVSAAIAATRSERLSDLSAMGVLLGRGGVLVDLGGAIRRGNTPNRARDYQLDFVMPGNSPRCAIARNRTREMPNLLRTPRGRPSIESRERTRTGDALRGSFCRP